jgi:hypothetical protein
MRLSVKLAALCAASALIPSIILSTMVLSRASARSREDLNRQLEKEARAAASFFEKRLVEMSAAAAVISDEIQNRAMVSQESKDGKDTGSAAAWSRLQDLLTHAQQRFALDFITVADASGKIIAQRPALDESLLGAQDETELAKKTLAGQGQPIAFAAVERGDRYARLGLDRLVRAAASPVDEALVIESAAPIAGAGGVVVIGQMLNVYYNPRPKTATGFPESLATPLVTEIRQSLFRNASEDAGALVALGNTIVASSISTGEGAGQPPLVGQARDVAGGQQIISQGARSYATAWLPMKSSDGTEVGAIGVARNAAEIEGATSSLRALLVIITAVTTIVSGAIGFLYGYSLATRVNDLSEAASRWSVGDLSTAARDRDPMMSRWIPEFFARDEMSRLAERLEGLRESFRQAIERMRKR